MFHIVISALLLSKRHLHLNYIMVASNYYLFWLMKLKKLIFTTTQSYMLDSVIPEKYQSHPVFDIQEFFGFS